VRTVKKDGDRRELGDRSEQLAARYLRRQGLRILEMNHRCQLGEIDIVAKEGETVVFVEVKSKTSRERGRPEEMITAAKRRKLTDLASAYLGRRGRRRGSARFDVVTILWGPGGEKTLKYYRNAFDAEGGW
jgi:putative endonuclease